MRRSGLFVAALLLVSGCDSSGSVDTGIPQHLDGGAPEGYVVILDGGGDAAVPPDGQAACPAGVCNYQTGEGCQPPTPACVPALGNGGVVTPACEAADAGVTGGSCSHATDCAPGYLCSSDSTCHKLCCGGDWTGCDSPSQHCIETLLYQGTDGGSVNTGAMLCYPINTCDALEPTSCTAPGTACVIADRTGATACLAEGAGTTGQPCPCKGGFVCLTDSKGTACHRLCGAVAGGAPPYCQTGEGICVHYNRDPPGVGECVELSSSP
jgi:hypothetical protein